VSLEDDLKSAVRNGLLTLSLSKDWEGPNWRCEFRNVRTLKVETALDSDPAEAMRQALRGGVRALKKDDPKPARVSVNRREDDLI